MVRNRKGHIEFLLLLVVMCFFVIIATSLVAWFRWGGMEEAPNWYRWFAMLINPASLILILMVSVYAVTFTAMGVAALERQAERIGLACWQYEKRRVYGLPLWLWKRSAVVISALGVTTVVGLLWYGGWDPLLAASTVGIAGLTLVAMLFSIGITLIFAQFSPEPARQIF